MICRKRGADQNDKNDFINLLLPQISKLVQKIKIIATKITFQDIFFAERYLEILRCRVKRIEKNVGTSALSQSMKGIPTVACAHVVL